MNNNSNPFFQYVNNNKVTSGISLSSSEQGVDQTARESVGQGNIKQGERKRSDVVSDPRRPPPANTVTPPPSKPTEEPKKLSTETRPQNDDLKQKRSRSRQGRISKNRDQSQQSNKKQKREEHFHKTKLCPLYEKGECKKGAQCHFAHGFKELRCLPNFYKTRLCLSFQKGDCKKPSIQCKYAHGQNDLRDLRHDAGYSNTINQSGNDIKQRQNDDRERRNFSNDDKRKKYERDSRGNRKDRRDRDAEQSHRRDKHHKDSFNRDESNERRRKSQKVEQNALGYKKNIPLSKEYEKFLYSNDSEPKSQYETHNSMYMIPNGIIPTGGVSSSYEQDLYSINQHRKQGDKTGFISYPGQPQTYPQPNAKSYKQFPNTLPYNNYPDQPNSQLKPYDNSSSYNKKFQQQPLYINQKQQQDKYSQPQQQSFVQQNIYAPQINSQPYTQQFNTNNEYSTFYQPPIFSQENRLFNDDSVYSQFQRNLPTAGGPIIVDKLSSQQSFYKNNDSFYPPASIKTNDTNFLPPPNQPTSNIYQSNYPKNEVYDLYPALDNSTIQSQKYLYPYEKSRYSSFSTNPQK